MNDFPVRFRIYQQLASVIPSKTAHLGGALAFVSHDLSRTYAVEKKPPVGN